MKFRFYILIILINCFSNYAASAQKNSSHFTLSGKITDTSDAPLGGASIYISDLRKGDISDANGNYEIKNIPRGEYVVEIKYIGYKTILRNIDFTENKIDNEVLKIAVTEQSEIVITGSSKATSIKRNPIPIVTVDKKFLTQNLSTNIIDAIAKVPGISEVTTGPNVSKPFIRGLGFNRILTMYDGIRQEGQQWGDEHGVEIDENTVNKVEVVKGPASLIYGSDAVAGVINMLPATPPMDGKITGNILTNYQTNNRLIENSATIAGHKNDITWGGTFTHKMATNYKNKFDGRVYNTGFAETDASANMGIHKSWGYSRIGLSMYNDLQEIPDGSRDSASRKFTKQITEDDIFRPIVSSRELKSYSISDLHQHVQHYTIYNSNNFFLGRGRLGLDLSFQNDNRQEFSHPEKPVPGLFLILNTYTYDAKYFFPESKGFSISTGINGMYQTNKVDRGTEFIIPSYQQFDFGQFVFAKKNIDKLEIAAGLRYDIRNFSNDGLYTGINPETGFEQVVSGTDTTGAHHPFSSYRHTFSGITGSLGFSYKFNNQFSMKANIGRGYRAPNISEISSNGVHPGTNMYQIGNQDFKPEFSLQEDIGVEFNSTHVTINGSVFNNSIQNYIYNEKLINRFGADSVIVPGNQTFKFVASKANLYGGEFSIDIHPHPWDWLHFENTLSMVYAVNKGLPGDSKVSDSAKYLPFIPPLHTSSELRANIKKAGKVFANAFIKIQFDIYAAQNRVYLQNNTETPTPGYQLFNAGLGSDILNKKGKTMFTFSVFGNNLLNVAYQSGLNRLKYFEPFPDNTTGHHGIYNMGRNIGLRIDVPLKFKD